MNCPKCGGKGVIRKNKGEEKQYKCKKCGKYWQVNPNISKFPKVLVFDIETAPLKVYSWGVHDQNIHPENVIEDWFILSWAGKWLNDDNTFGDVVTPKEAVEQDDKRIVNSLWKAFDDAEIVMGHNSSGFDIPKANARFFKHRLKPPSYYQQIDTLLAARKAFALTSNKLDEICKYLELPVKLETNFKLWSDCKNGDKNALKTMFTYNKNDVKILEDVYFEMRPWIPKHPNMGVYVQSDNSICPICISSNLQMGKNPYTTSTGEYKSYRCLNCGALGRDRKNSISKYKMQVLIKA